MNQNILRFFTIGLLVCLSGISSLQAQALYSNGGPGLFLVPDPEPIGKGDTQLSTQVNFARYDEDFQAGDDRLYSVGLTHGLSDKMDLGIRLPYMNGDNSDSERLRNITTYVKYNFYEDANIRLGWSAYVTSSEVLDSPELASGLPNDGLAFNASRYATSGYHFYHFSIEDVDVKRKAIGPVYYQDKGRRYTFSYGKQYEFNNSQLDLSTALNITEFPVGNDSNFYLSLGYQYQRDRNLGYDFAVAVGLPQKEAEPQLILHLGLSYVYRPRHWVVNTHQTSSSIKPSAPESMDVNMDTTNDMTQEHGAHKPHPEIEAKKDSGDEASDATVSPASMVELPITSSESETSAAQDEDLCRFRIDVLNVSGLPRLAHQMVQTLNGQGYCVSAVYQGGQFAQLESVIYYHNVDEHIAQQLAERIQINQVIPKLLGEDVDMRIIVGRDRR